MELAEALLHTLNVVGEETGKEKEGTGRAACEVPCHLAGFSAIARTQREIKIPPLRLLGGHEITQAAQAAHRRCLLSALSHGTSYG